MSNANMDGFPLREISSASMDSMDFGKIAQPNSSMGLITAIAVDGSRLAADGLRAIRMVGFANQDALRLTMTTKLATYYSRSRNGLWVKGEESGNTLEVIKAYADCDRDVLLLDVKPNGPTCHNGTNSCFEVNNVGE